MRKISIINYKGGTGKTCTVVNIAHGLTLRGKKVLLIDTDPQGSVAYHLGLKPKYTLYDILVNKESVENCIIRARPNLDVICSNEHLYVAEMSLAKYQGRETILSEKLANIQNYDFILLDCAPSMNLLNQNALLYTTEIFLPVSMEYLSLIGVKQLLKNIKIINKLFNRRIRITKVIPTFYDSRYHKSKDILNSLNRVFPNLVSSPIRVSVALSEAPGNKKSVFEYDASSMGAEDYYRLIEEVLAYE